MYICTYTPLLAKRATWAIIGTDQYLYYCSTRTRYAYGVITVVVRGTEYLYLYKKVPRKCTTMYVYTLHTQQSGNRYTRSAIRGTCTYVHSTLCTYKYEVCTWYLVQVHSTS